MSNELKEGVKLQTIHMPPDPREGIANYTVGHYKSPISGVQLTEIVVREQLGQVGMVPWAELSYADGTTTLVNLAHAEAVDLLPEES